MSALAAAVTLVAGLLVVAHVLWQRSIARNARAYETPTVAFFHPQCMAGGGGERVLWVAVAEMQRCARVAIYASAGMPENSAIVDRVKIDAKNLDVRALWTSKFADAQRYPVFTLALQALGMAISGAEAAMMHPRPTVIVDTVGCVFAYPMWHLIMPTTRIAAYTHYPFLIKANAVNAVRSRRVKNPVLTMARKAYYGTISAASALAYKYAHAIAANSSWTLGHMDAILGDRHPSSLPTLTKIYPPCGHMLSDSDGRLANRPPVIISLGQFRPEKRHEMQLQIFSRVLERLPKDKHPPHFFIVGGTRGAGDKARVISLQKMCDDLDISKHVTFAVDAPALQVRSLLATASLGLHTMYEEHFGISIVEYMDAGVIPVAHRSGGPQSDIVTHRKTGFLCDTAEEYADAIISVLYEMSPGRVASIRRLAKEHAAQRFADKYFARALRELALPRKTKWFDFL